VQSDGKLLLTGTDSQGLDWYITRLGTDAVIDSSYGKSGWVDTSANTPSGGIGTTRYGPIAVSGSLATAGRSLSSIASTSITCMKWEPRRPVATRLQRRMDSGLSVGDSKHSFRKSARQCEEAERVWSVPRTVL
jgi:hypothetical protein